MASLQISLKIALPPIDSLPAIASISASFKHAKHLALIPSSTYTWGGGGEEERKVMVNAARSYELLNS